MKVGIVGAGIAGLACAARLKQAGIEPVLFDKGKRPGGRLSTLRLDRWVWDFGCQYLKPGVGAFAIQVAQWRAAGLVAAWPEGPAEALVGVPAMASLVEAQSRDHRVQLHAQVQRLERDRAGWFVAGPGLREGAFAALALAIPAEQAAPLLSLHDLGMARETAAVRSQPCWTVMAAFPKPLIAPAYLRDCGMIAWAARNNSKPGRGSAECWVIQANPEWSLANLERDPEEIARQILALFATALGTSLPEPDFLKAHRWRFALSYGQSGNTLWNPRLRLGACGDWCMAGHVEGAWRAGVDLAGRVIATLTSESAELALSTAQ
jgi:renalase